MLMRSDNLTYQARRDLTRADACINVGRLSDGYKSFAVPPLTLMGLLLQPCRNVFERPEQRNRPEAESHRSRRSSRTQPSLINVFNCAPDLK